MHIIAVNHVNDGDRYVQLPTTWEVYTTALPIMETYRTLAQVAIDGDWGLDTIVVQDDVRFTEDPVVGHGYDLVVYGQAHKHVCPRAFAATRQGWLLLLAEWRNETKDTLCPGFTRVVNALDAPVLNITEHLWGVRSNGAETA